MVKDENKMLDLCTPVCAFVTFTTDDGKNEALAFSEKAGFFKKNENIVKESIFNQEPKFTDSTQPTNIIWENRHIKGVNYGLRVFSALLIITLMLTMAFWVIFAFKQA